MGLERFEQRMMKLKGIKLPSEPLVEDSAQRTGRPAKSVPNRHAGTLLLDLTQEDEHKVNHAMEDIIVGVVRSFDVATSHNGMKINVAVVRNMLNKLPEITSQAIQNNFGYSRAHAKRYAQACRLVLMHKQRHEFKQLKRFTE